jgi:NAD(P)-dependent dehydrogenase (short-subunit alcohol dehydrogenase family)
MTAKPIALVTGAAQGIGLACAEALLEQGAFVVLSDINAERVKASALRLGPSADFVVSDMSDSTAISAMFDAVEEKHGPVSILVNNAGVAIPEPFLEATEETFRKVIDINLIGVFLATQRAAKVHDHAQDRGFDRQHVVDQCGVGDSDHRLLLFIQRRHHAAYEGGFAGACAL